MTHEEAKKMGATHYNEFGSYFKENNNQHWFRLLVVNSKIFWVAQIFKLDGIKPL